MMARKSKVRKIKRGKSRGQSAWNQEDDEPNPIDKMLMPVQYGQPMMTNELREKVAANMSSKLKEKYKVSNTAK